jgi:hypothetical protein
MRKGPVNKGPSSIEIKLKGDLDKAGAEMAQSKYDTDHDGRCDASACEHVRAKLAWGVMQHAEHRPEGRHRAGVAQRSQRSLDLGTGDVGWSSAGVAVQGRLGERVQLAVGDGLVDDGPRDTEHLSGLADGHNVSVHDDSIAHVGRHGALDMLTTQP